MLDLSDKVAVITGAGSGIGRGIALELARAGTDIVSSDLFTERAEETATLVRDLGRRSLAVRADVREQESLQALAERAVSEFGRLDICVANAGIFRSSSVLTMTQADWDASVAINQTGVFLTVQACAREMVRAGHGGRVIVISSLAAETAPAGMSSYCATKAAVAHAARCWAIDLAPYGITVNSIGPGYIETRMLVDMLGDGEERAAFEARIPLGRVGQPRDIGLLACWLASDESGHITGAFHKIDAGQHDGRGAVDLMHTLRTQAATLRGDALLAAIDAEAEQARGNIRQRRSELGLV